jgi:hypothetical protein
MKARIACLFAERDKAAARLARIDRLLSRAGSSYSRKAGYRANLRQEALRREVGA